MSQVTRAKIYTRTGDKGTTRLVDGSCVEKFNPRVEAYGCVDELNSHIGVIRSLISENPSLTEAESFLERIQNLLFNIGSLLATQDSEVFKNLPALTPEHVTEMEKQIDLLSADLAPLKNFILPAGHLAASHTHVARTSCRRAERRSAEIAVQDDRYALCLQYLNRLSDYLFVLARWMNFKTQTPEKIWQKL